MCDQCEKMDEELTLLRKRHAQEIAGLKRVIAEQEKRERGLRAEVERLKDQAAGVDRGKVPF